MKNKRPSFIKAKTIKDATIRDSSVIGDADFLSAQSVEGLDASGNVHITPMPSTEKPWYLKPLGILLLAVVGSLIAAAIVALYAHVF